jgi:isochorismate synthase
VLSDLLGRLEGLPTGLRIASMDIDLDPIEVVRAGAAAFASAAVYATPDGTALGGLGTAWLATASGHDRLERLDKRLQELPEGAEAFVGFAFGPEGPTDGAWDRFPNAVAFVPQVMVTRIAGRSRLTVAVAPGGTSAAVRTVLGALRPPGPAKPHPGEDHRVRSIPPPEEWREGLSEAVAMLRAGAAAKVVLARSLQLETGRPIEPFELAARLRDRYPASRTFAFQIGHSAFLGATPEMLASRRGRRFQSVPLAGSAPRGADPEADRRQGDRLLGSRKDRAEHQFVVDEVVARLRPLAETLDVPPEPLVARFATVQHLATTVTGTGTARLLSLVSALHPTPAVAGAPTTDALAIIDKLERVDRGWYAGGVGWGSPGGDGEVAVALRCALVQDGTARLYAGGGIVAESVPQAELEETRLKFRPMLDLLTGR